jgi:hypothetical protein
MLPEPSEGLDLDSIFSSIHEYVLVDLVWQETRIFLATLEET